MIKLNEILSFFSIFFNNDIKIRLHIAAEFRTYYFHLWEYESPVNDIVKNIEKKYGYYNVLSFGYLEYSMSENVPIVQISC